MGYNFPLHLFTPGGVFFFNGPGEKLYFFRENIGFWFSLKPLIFYNGFSPKKFELVTFSKGNFSVVLTGLKSLLKFFGSFYFLRLKLRGLGFRVKHMSSRLLRIFMGYTNFIYIHIPPSLFLRGRRRRLYFFSNNKGDLITFFLNFFALKIYIPYKLRGFSFQKKFCF